LVTHAHEDRTGGVAALPEAATIHARTATVELAADQGRTFSAATLSDEESLQLAGGRIETFFPGAGHTADNIVVWLPEQRLLFGGCFIKSMGATDLGNVADADLASWRLAVQRVRERHAEPAVVVPGHGALGGPELLAHTAALLEAAAD
jgi:metallo-beta-lactamase class B